MLPSAIAVGAALVVAVPGVAATRRWLVVGTGAFFVTWSADGIDANGSFIRTLGMLLLDHIRVAFETVRTRKSSARVETAALVASILSNVPATCGRDGVV